MLNCCVKYLVEGKCFCVNRKQIAHLSGQLASEIENTFELSCRGSFSLIFQFKLNLIVAPRVFNVN